MTEAIAKAAGRAHICVMTRRLFPVRLLHARLALAAAATLLITGCATAVPPVAVTRFHTPALASLAHGTAFRFADAEVATNLPGEDMAYRLAVGRELQRLGFVEAKGEGNAPLVIRVNLARSDRNSLGPAPVSIGVGGSTGSYGSGLGVGLGFNLGGGPRLWSDLSLGVRIDDAATDSALWEGRANASIPAKAPAAQPSLAAAKLAAALFEGFPGESGRTISVP